MQYIVDSIFPYQPCKGYRYIYPCLADLYGNCSVCKLYVNMSYNIQLEAKLVTRSRWIFLGEHCNHNLTYLAQDALKNAFHLNQTWPFPVGCSRADISISIYLANLDFTEIRGFPPSSATCWRPR